MAGERMHATFASLRRRVYSVSFAALLLAMVCLLWDLGAPERALLIFLHPHPTVLTFGAYTLATEAVIAAVLTAVHLWGRPTIGGCVLTVLELLRCIDGLAVMAYAGVFPLGGGIAFWNTRSLIGLFTFSSLSASISSVLLVDWFIRDQALLLGAARPLQRLHLLFLAAETSFLTLFLTAAFNNPHAAAAQAALTSPDMLACAVVGIGGFGIALPAVLKAYSLAKANNRAIPAADIARLIGCLILRYVIITYGVR